MALTKVSRGLLNTSIVDNGNATAITIDSSENVGIGTTAMYGRTNSIPKAAYNAAGTNWAESAYTAAGSWGGGYSLIDGSAGYLLAAESAGTNLVIRQGTVGSTPTERMRIDSSGNVGIGTTSPSENLHVVGQCRVSDLQQYGGPVLRVDLTGGSYGYGLYVTNASLGGTGTTAYFQTTSSAKNVTFSNGSTTSIFATFNKYNSTAAGHIRMTSNVLQYQVLSDARAKENIADAGDAGSKIDAIQVRQFDWIEGGLHEEFGFIAQELAPIVPLAVGGDPDGEEMMGVDASKLVPLLVKEIQSLRARVTALEE